MPQITNGASTSVWMATSTVPVFAPLPGNTRAGVCVIGAGIAGLTTAYLLAREGQDVVLIDAIGVGAGETGRTTAHFFPPDEWYAGVEQTFGAARARRVAESFGKATTLVETIVRRENIACDFERLDGYLYTLPGNNFTALDVEFEAAQRAGVDVDILPRVPGLPFDSGPCVRFFRQAQLHPLNYLAGLARAFVEHGGRIFGGTRALSISGDSRRQTVHTERGLVSASAVVVATNTPFNNQVVMHTKQAAYLTYVVALRVPRGSVPRILLWDHGDPYYYVRVATPEAGADYELLIVGGADHKVGQVGEPQQRWDEIERWARAHFPMAGLLDYRWSGEIMEPADGAAFLGRNPLDDGNVYLITGDSGNGMTHATIGAMLITDLVCGRDNPWTTLYDPSRPAVHGLRDFVVEQANTLSQYAAWLKAGDVGSVDEIAPGTGAIIRDGARRLAVHRDVGGALYVLSARCTHLGCVVQWNAAELTWDCPCHGSRFASDGRVVHGPARVALEPASLGGAAPSQTRSEARPKSQ